MKCERCGRPLTSKVSIERGMGLKCARITELEKQSKNENQELVELKQKWNQLSLKFSLLEKKVNRLIKSGVKSTEVIERIKEKVEAAPTEEGRLKGLIHEELVSIFRNKDGSFNPDWKSKILHKTDEINEIREPPSLKEVN